MLQVFGLIGYIKHARTPLLLRTQVILHAHYLAHVNEDVSGHAQGYMPAHTRGMQAPRSQKCSTQCAHRSWLLSG